MQKSTKSEQQCSHKATTPKHSLLLFSLCSCALITTSSHQPTERQQGKPVWERETKKNFDHHSSHEGFIAGYFLLFGSIIILYLLLVVVLAHRTDFVLCQPIASKEVCSENACSEGASVLITAIQLIEARGNGREKKLANIKSRTFFVL